MILANTERLMLRLLEVEDVDDVKSFWGNEEVMAHSGGAIPHEKIPNVIDSYANCQKVKGLSVYAIVEKESGKVIGGAGFNVRDSVETVELIYHFAKQAWGKGYATEAAAACINIAKENDKVKRIYASADPQNVDSLRILEKIGFQYQGMKWFDDSKQEEPHYEMLIPAN